MSRAKAMMASLSAACAVLSVVVVVLSVRSCQSAQACVETALEARIAEWQSIVEAHHRRRHAPE